MQPPKAPEHAQQSPGNDDDDGVDFPSSPPSASSKVHVPHLSPQQKIQVWEELQKRSTGPPDFKLAGGEFRSVTTYFADKNLKVTEKTVSRIWKKCIEAIHANDGNSNCIKSALKPSKRHRKSKDRSEALDKMVKIHLSCRKTERSTSEVLDLPKTSFQRMKVKGEVKCILFNGQRYYLKADESIQPRDLLALETP